MDNDSLNLSDYKAELNIQEDVALEYKESAGSANSGFHFHEEFEMLLCLSDNMFLDLEKNHFDINANTLLLFNSTDLHFFSPKLINGENKRYVLNFDPASLDFLCAAPYNLLDCYMFRPFDNGAVLPLDDEQALAIRHKLDYILRLQSQSESECFGRQLLIKLSLCELLLIVNGIYNKYHNICVTISSDRRSIVYDIMNYIHTHYTDDLSLDLLSKKFYINKYALCAIFRDVAAVTPSQYIIDWRITKAKKLLISGHSVEDACTEAGFNNLSHFSRTFKQRVGQSPKQYQKAMMKKSISKNTRLIML